MILAEKQDFRFRRSKLVALAPRVYLSNRVAFVKDAGHPLPGD